MWCLLVPNMYCSVRIDFVHRIQRYTVTQLRVVEMNIMVTWIEWVYIESVWEELVQKFTSEVIAQSR